MAQPRCVEFIAERDAAALAGNQVDAEIFLSECRAERSWNIQIAARRERVHVGGAAPAVFSINGEHHLA